MTRPSLPPRPIRAVLSDIDGTLVRSDKSLSPAVIDAVTALRRAGIAFSIASARPPRALSDLVNALHLGEAVDGADTQAAHGAADTADAAPAFAPIAAFNGGNIIAPDQRVLDALRLPPAVAREVVTDLQSRGLSPWIFTEGEWRITDPNAAYVDVETRTLGYGPTVVDAFTDHDFASVDKILAASADFDGLARIEHEIAKAFSGKLNTVRSQKYYLDITHPDAHKGTAAHAIARHLGIGLDELAVLGDMSNDLPMFDVAGFAIAMGQSEKTIQQRANVVTASNDDDGVAKAIYEWILPSQHR
ncbi:HAD family hydrolase [Robbsia sp. KACC 23696]|uniref:HAD family hydrolase n=1 Tax=Robbsia sp. KACC 23696 TaxID=3149231 RepID=UPI00325AE18D